MRSNDSQRRRATGPERSEHLILSEVWAGRNLQNELLNSRKDAKKYV
jgi:hypothetical protein